jgi:hypothetical protein
LDEPTISKCLKHVLKKMKKNEISNIEITDNTLVRFGKDFEILKEKFGDNIPKKFNYLIKVYNFTEGKNTFNMTIDEKCEHAIRKK